MLKQVTLLENLVCFEMFLALKCSLLWNSPCFKMHVVVVTSHLYVKVNEVVDQRSHLNLNNWVLSHY